MNGISARTRDPREPPPLLLLPCEAALRRRPSVNQEAGPHHVSRHLGRGLLAFETGRSNALSFMSHPVWATLVPQPRWTNEADG